MGKMKIKQHILKVITYKTISILVLYSLLTLFGLPTHISGMIVSLDTIITGGIYFIFEEVWDIPKIKIYLTNCTKIRIGRHALKALLYRIISIIELFVLNIIFQVPITTSLAIVIIFEILSSLQYFIFEEVWDTIKDRISNNHVDYKSKNFGSF